MSSINISCVPALVLQFPQSTGLDDLLPFGGQPGHIMRPSERITCVATFGQMMIYTGQDRQLGSQAARQTGSRGATPRLSGVVQLQLLLPL